MPCNPGLQRPGYVKSGFLGNMVLKRDEVEGKKFYARYVLFVLLGVYVSNQWARYLLNYLYAVSDDSYDDDDERDFVSIEDATGISTMQYGLLVGYGFSFFYVIFGLFMGRAADLYNRKNIVFYGLVIWNLATIFQGMSSNFVQLLLARVLLGIGESFSMPASYSLIADYFPPDVLAQANGVFAFGVYVGGGLSSLSIAMAKGVGWRMSSFVVAGYGLLLSLLVRLTIREPPRSRDAGESGERNNNADPRQDEDFTMRQSIRLIFKEPLIVLLIIGGMVRFMAGFAIGSYLPDFYSEVFSDYNTIYSYLNASVVSIGGALSSYLGGLAADRSRTIIIMVGAFGLWYGHVLLNAGWEKAGQYRARMYIPAIGALLGIPTFMLVILVPSFYGSMFALFLEYLAAECWFGPAISVLQRSLPPRVRGVGIGCYTFFTTIAGSFMTYVLGLLLDTYTSNSALKLILLIAVCSTYATCGVIFLVASTYMTPLDGLDVEKQPLLGRGIEDMEEEAEAPPAQAPLEAPSIHGRRRVTGREPIS